MIKWDKAYAHKSDAFSRTPKWEHDASYSLRLLPDTDQGAVLDYACNTGSYIDYVRENSDKNPKFIGMDINEDGLDIARSRYPESKFVSSLDELDSDPIDLVVCIHALPQFENPMEVLSSIWEVMDRGARIYIVTHNKHNELLWNIPNLFNGYIGDQTISHEYAMGDLKTLMRDSGFIEEDSGRLNYPESRFYKVFPFLSQRIYFLGRKP